MQQERTLINRKVVLSRHNPLITSFDTLSSLTVGNGHFAVTVDATGMQSFPEYYSNGVPLCAMSDWGWHSFPNVDSLRKEESQRSVRFPFRSHDEIYAVEYKNGGRGQAATSYYRANPHRLNLGTIGLSIYEAQLSTLNSQLSTFTDIRQELQLYDGLLRSHFVTEEKTVDVLTACMPDRDAVIYQIKSPLLRDGHLAVNLRFSYPTGRHSDDANDWTKPECHSSRVIRKTDHSALIQRTLDTTTYYLSLRWEGKASLTEVAPHHFQLSSQSEKISFEAYYCQHLPSESTESTFSFSDAVKQVRHYWNKNWQQGAFVDFSQCTDPRAFELERRIVLSQYLTLINCANDTPPQETGLTYNSWFGRPHLEMTWWHAIHFALWHRPEILEHLMQWYSDVAYPKAEDIARRQGYKGVRWMKMTDPWAGEAPSNVGSFLIWQQPHVIYMAEQLYRANPTTETLTRYARLVEATAEWMADFVCRDSITGQFQLRGATAMQESMSKDFSYNHPFELAYWHYGLQTVQQWRLRQGLQRCVEWDTIISNLSPLPQSDGIYTAGEPIIPMVNDKWSVKSRSDHPAVLGTCGLLPSNLADGVYSPQVMKQTLQWVLDNWNWDTTWGWDYGMVAMAAARLGRPETAVDILLSDYIKNRYLPSGHNFQTADRLRLYLPGNGALLTAIAMMCAGWDGAPAVDNPGFPQDGKWHVRWEGLTPMQ
ncbi:MAG: hypothetical protein J6Y41_07980 [Bacteroidaceae bacterium]|nr:hypothetical protein [Bacteroidaceae bacterium]